MPTSLLLALLTAPRTPLAGVAARNVAAFRQAVLKRDVAWFERTYAPDFTQKTGASTIDRRGALAQLKGGLLKMHVASLKTKILSVNPKGSGYVASVAFVGTMVAGVNGQPATLTAKWKDDQTWVPVKGRWLIKGLSTREFERAVE